MNNVNFRNWQVIFHFKTSSVILFQVAASKDTGHEFFEQLLENVSKPTNFSLGMIKLVWH